MEKRRQKWRDGVDMHLKGKQQLGERRTRKAREKTEAVCSMAKCCQEEAERENEAHRREG